VRERAVSGTYDERGLVRAALERGRVVFAGVPLEVAPGALVPREETELLARTAIALLAGFPPAPRVIDMCCGAGNLACAIAHHVPSARVWASDLTDACVALTCRNVEALGLGDRVSVHQGDLFESLSAEALGGSIDMIVCNPPYISQKRLAEERAALLELEPQEAFAAGPYGLGIHQRVIRDAPGFLRHGGLLLVEIGAGQDRQVETLFARARKFDDIRHMCDAAGVPRVAHGRRRPD
jgi:release factor glutamine methyltransferase